MDGTISQAGEGLRARKKRLTRQRLSDTATRLFLERGFDAVRVAEIAETCEVSEKTVFNYFPTKEALLLDRLEGTEEALRTELARRDLPPVQAALRILADELRATVAVFNAAPDPAAAMADHRRFGDLIRATISLRAHQSDMTDRFVAVAAEALARRGGVDPGDAEPQITAAALLGLWRVQFHSLRRHLDGTRSPAQVHRAVTADVEQAAHVLDDGLAATTAAVRTTL